MACYLLIYDSIKRIKIAEKESFEPMNYKLPGIYKFYSTIINTCFEYLRDSNSTEIMKQYDNYCIAVSGDGSSISYEYMFNATVNYFNHHV